MRRDEPSFFSQARKLMNFPVLINLEYFSDHDTATNNLEGDKSSIYHAKLVRLREEGVVKG